MYESSKTEHSSNLSTPKDDNSLVVANDSPSINVDVSRPPTKTGATKLQKIPKFLKAFRLYLLPFFPVHDQY